MLKVANLTMNTKTNNVILVHGDTRTKIKDIVLRLLNECDIHDLPVDLKTILKLNNIYLLNSKKAIEYGVINFAYNDFDGKNVYIDGCRFIIYNLNHPVTRQRWTMAHELGHILLDHREQSRVNEAEANYFARQLLMPMAVLVKMNKTSVEDVCKVCNVSGEASKNRQKDFKRHYEFKSKYGLTKHDIAFLKQFGMCEFSNELAI